MMYFDSDQTDVDFAAAIGDDRGVIGPRSWTFRLILLQPSDDDRTTTSRLHLDEDSAFPSFHMASSKLSNRRQFYPSMKIGCSRCFPEEVDVSTVSFDQIKSWPSDRNRAAFERMKIGRSSWRHMAIGERFHHGHLKYKSRT